MNAPPGDYEVSGQSGEKMGLGKMLQFSTKSLWPFLTTADVVSEEIASLEKREF